LEEERATVPLTRLILATCERVKEDIIEHLGIRANRIHVVHLGIDAELFRPITREERIAIRSQRGWDQSDPILIFVGALGDDRKGFDTLFDAWEILCRDPAWDGHLAVVGQGAGLLDWKKKAIKRGLEKRIEFLGFLKGLPSVLAACDALVLPSRYEGYSLVAQEALCCGLPAFISRSAGIADRYPPDLQRLLIPDPDDPEDLAQRLRSWRCDMELYKTGVSTFAEKLRAHTWEIMAERILAIIARD
jgi:glycosyltransferase involved in cell wall biosynthesis